MALAVVEAIGCAWPRPARTRSIALALHLDQFRRGVPRCGRMRPDVLHRNEVALLALPVQFRLNLRQTDFSLRVAERIADHFKVLEYGATLGKPVLRKRHGGLRFFLRFFGRHRSRVALRCFCHYARRLIPKFGGIVLVQGLQLIRSEL